MFAVRALKSAVWGTPALPEDETIHEVEKKKHDEENKTWKQMKLADIGAVSPTKPAGILLTPGIGAARRKNVVFGTEVVDNEGKSAARKAVLRDGSNTSSSLESSSKSKTKTSLTRTLENSRQRKVKNQLMEERSSQAQETNPLVKEGKPLEKKGISAKPQQGSTTKRNTFLEAIYPSAPGVDNDGDMTMDLNEPHSQSGKYWKSEFETYQGEMKEQMEKILRYKQLAKSYAKKKDTEASELSAKLKEEQSRVHKMEARMSELSARIAIDGSDDDSPELIKELARQTALAVQLRSQVQEFQAAMEGNADLASYMTGKPLSFPQDDQAPIGTSEGSRKTKTQLKEETSLREEVRQLRQALTTAEKSSMNLQEENTRLTRNLLHKETRLEKHQEKSEKQRLWLEEQMRKRDEMLRDLQKDYDSLKEQLKTQRRESEQLMKRRHDQPLNLRKEPPSSNDAALQSKEFQHTLERMVPENHKIIADSPTQFTELGEHIRDNSVSINTKDISPQSRRAQQKPSQSSHDQYFDSQIPSFCQSIAQPSKILAPSRSAHSHTPAGSPVVRLQASHQALSEINNNSSSIRHHPAFAKADLLRATPLRSRSEDVMLAEPNMDLPSPEPSLLGLPSRPRYEIKSRGSPGPSMFNLASSPPKPTVSRSRSFDGLSAQKSDRDVDRRRHADISSSRLSRFERSGSKGKSTIPPERAAAARARLQRKNAEKRRAQSHSMDKENVR